MSIDVPATDGDGAMGPSHRFIALDALRGAAALAVLFYHLRSVQVAGHSAIATGGFASGYLAVDLFFLLSGFVISHAYGTRLGRTLSFRDFVVVRFIRLQPVIAIGTLLGLAFLLAQRILGLPGAPGLFAIATSLPPNLLLLPNLLVPWGIFLLNPPAWSLFYELLANTGYALLLRRRDPDRSVMALVILKSVCIAGLAGVVASVALLGDLDRGVVLQDAPAALSRIAFSFPLGVLLHRTRLVWAGRMPRLPMPVLLVACIVLLAPGLSGQQRQVYDLGFVTVLSPSLVMLTAVATPGRLTNAAVWLGAISYPLYGIHAPIKHLVETFVPLGRWPMLTVITVIAIAAAWLVATVIDPALRLWLGKALQPRLRELPTATPIIAVAPSPTAR